MNTMESDNTVSCEKCHVEISEVYMKCTECIGQIFFCLNCFSAGCEVGKHLNTHSYQIVDKSTFSLLCDKWSAKEEQALLFGIEQFGLGNWEDVAEFITSKTSKEAEDHYIKYYVDSSDMGRASVPANIPNRITDHTPPLHESLVSIKLPECWVSKSCQLSLAYMPQRDDFELEHDNDAETIVSEITILNEESEIEVKLKVAQSQMYVTRLKERQDRKTLCQEYQLVSSFFGKSFLSVKEDADFFENIKPCIRFMKQTQMKRFIFDWQKEKRLRSQISRLIRYRKHGLKKLGEIETFEILQKKHEKLLSDKKQTLTVLQDHKPEDVRVRVRDIALDGRYISPGSQLLNHNEQKLCQVLKMQPTKYITCKMLLFRDVILKKHAITNVKNRLHLFTDKNQRKKIHRLVQSSGWMNESVVSTSS